MNRQDIVVIAALFLLNALVIQNLTGEAEKARQESFKARDLSQQSEQYEVQVMEITMYAPLSPGAVSGRDFSGDPSRTASGEKLVPGETAAAGPNIPFGTRIYVEGIGWRTVTDRGSAIGPNRIDIAVETIEEAAEFGIQQRLVIFKRPDTR